MNTNARPPVLSDMRYGIRRRRSSISWLVAERWRLHRQQPVTFAQKVRYRMVHARNPVMRTFADKAATRDYVRRRLGEQFLPKLFDLATGQAGDLLRSVPDRCVHKPTHGSGAVIVLDERTAAPTTLPRPQRDSDWFPLTLRSPKRAIEPEWLTDIFQHWMARDYSFAHPWCEWAYHGIPKRILVEELLDDRTGVFPTDVKVHVFHGRVGLVQTFGRRGEDVEIRGFFAPTCEPIPLRPSAGPPSIAPFGTARPPDRLRDIIELAETLADGVSYVRADFYAVGDRIIIGELTNYPSGGQVEFLNPDGVEWCAPTWAVASRRAD